MSFFTSLRISGSALTAQRLRMDVISNNIANMHTTRTARGGPYKREQVVFTTPESPRGRFGLAQAAPVLPMQGVQVSAIVEDDQPGPSVYEPEHPDADADGYVIYPNVDVATEMVDMLSAARAYEANVTVIQTTKDMAAKALDIARG
ncbi:MAG TPA: flagellar basal body rod protein FlgC [Anaerolineae bacterium]|nr:flagellar basal body rod protein FlgC [Anaerolineae bacterium]